MGTERILQSRYRIVRALGRGGLGAVYLCEDLRLPSKHWALKQMHSPEPELRDQFRETFEREAAILARLQHPNLPLIVDYFDEDDEAYLVMEFVEGENLAQVVRRQGAMGEVLAFRYGLMIADLLAFLHSQKPPLIFRDLKPENIMLTPERTVKLIDFGLARRFVPGKRSDTMPSGSVGYAPPEQWEDLAQTDERSDIYSWGATMVHLLTGKIPSPVFPLSALRGAEPPLSEPGRSILARCVKARPAERFEDAASLSRDVRRHLEALGEGSETLSSRPVGTLEEVTPGVPDSGHRRRATDNLEPRSNGGPPSIPSREEGEAGPTVGVGGGRYATASSGPVGGRDPLTDSGLRTARQQERVSSTSAAASPPDEQPPGDGVAPHVGRSRAGWTARLPLMLLIVATFAFVNAVALAVVGSRGPTTRPSPSGMLKPTDSAGGIDPYQFKAVENRDREEGRQFYQERRYIEAVAALDRATTQVPEDAEAQILKENASMASTGAAFIRLPFIASLSGVDGPDSYSQLYGAALAQSVINLRGGIRGRKLILDVYDDHSSTPECLSIAKRLVRDDAVIVVLGPYNSQRAMAVAPLFNTEKINLVAPVASSQQMWDAGAYVFSAADTTGRRVRAMARHAIHSGFKRVGMVVDNTSRLSGEMRDTFRGEVTGKGVEMLDVPPFQAESDSFVAQGEAIKVLQPDLIFFADYRAATTARFVKQMREMGIRTAIMSQTIPFSQELVEVGGDAVDGLVLAGYFHPEVETPQARAFMASFRRRFGVLTPTHLAVNTYDALVAVAQVMDETAAQGRATRAALNAALHASGVTRPPFEGAGGRFALGRLLDARPVWLMEVRNHRYRLLEKLSEDTPN